MARFFYSPAKQRVLLLLAAGIVLGLSRSRRNHITVTKNLPRAWREIGRLTLVRILKEFQHKRLVDFVEEKNKTVRIVLTELGEKHVLRYNPEHLAVDIPSRWDKKWRVVVFDIPEKKRLARDTLRREMKKIGFFELQKSVWVIPYDCRDLIDFLVELFEVRNFVRFFVVSDISPDADLRLHFKLY